MGNEKITFFEKGEKREGSGDRWKIFLIAISPFLIVGFAFFLWFFVLYNSQDNALKKCNITEGDILEVDRACSVDGKRCDEKDCLMKELNSYASLSITDSIAHNSFRIIALSIVLFLLLIIFRNKHQSKFYRWIEAVLASTFFVVFLFFAGIFSIGILSIYLIPVQVLVAAIIATKIFRYSLLDAFIIFLFSYVFLWILSILF